MLLALLVVGLAPGTRLSIRQWATSKAVAAGDMIVETNQILANDDVATCEGEKCMPLRAAMAKQEGSLLRPRSRSSVANLRLDSAKGLLAMLDAEEKLDSAMNATVTELAQSVATAVDRAGATHAADLLRAKLEELTRGVAELADRVDDRAVVAVAEARAAADEPVDETAAARLAEVRELEAVQAAISDLLQTCDAISEYAVEAKSTLRVVSDDVAHAEDALRREPEGGSPILRSLVEKEEMAVTAEEEAEAEEALGLMMHAAATEAAVVVRPPAKATTCTDSVDWYLEYRQGTSSQPVARALRPPRKWLIARPRRKWSRPSTW